jgi:alcohol dehydrogenase (cytochrome c)
VHATAGGLVFGGTSDGWAFALDARNGKILWHFNVGGEIRASPISFVFEGRQHFSVAAGLSLFSFTLPD